MIGFQSPTEVVEVLVRGGQRVKQGDLLIRGRDEELVAQRDLQRLAAETEIPVERARAAMEQARVEMEAHKEVVRKSRIRGQNIELERARTMFLLREAEYKFAKLEQLQQGKQLEVREAQLNRMRRHAPFDGIVDMVAAESGQVYRDGEPLLRILNIEQLHLDVQTPAFQTIELGLKPGDPAWVLMDLPGEPQIFSGHVIEVGAEVDSASHTRRVRVELENPYQWPSGLNAWVRFTEPSSEWLARLKELPSPEAVASRLADAELRQLAPGTRATEPTPQGKPAGASE